MLDLYAELKKGIFIISTMKTLEILGKRRKTIQRYPFKSIKAKLIILTLELEVCM
jgi:hypothetical protein